MPPDFSAVMNATTYYADVTVPTTPVGTPVINFTVVINLSILEDISSVSLSVVKNDFTTDVFNFGGGRASETISPLPAIDPAANSMYYSHEHSIYYDGPVSQNTDLPYCFSFDINAIIVRSNGNGNNTVLTALGQVTVRGKALHHGISIHVYIRPFGNDGTLQVSVQPRDLHNCSQLVHPIYSLAHAGLCDPSPCMNGGTCSSNNTSFSCQCTVGYAGEYCELPVSLCEPNPCLNGGICVDGVGGQINCICDVGYTGSDCSIETTPCAVNICENGGTCNEISDNTIECSCAQDYFGSTCDEYSPICRSDSCLNGGMCTLDGTGGIVCTCPHGFSGTRCGTDLISCHSGICKNGGECMERLGNELVCFCAAGYTGTFCEIDVNFCEPDSCQNGGDCVEGPGTEISCNCPEGFGGLSCGQDLDFCTALMCDNGGTCMEGIGKATSCFCASGFSGDHCTIDNDYCQDTTCQNGGVCIEGRGDVVICNCNYGYAGEDCSLGVGDCFFAESGSLAMGNCSTTEAGGLGLRNCSTAEAGGCLNGGTCVLITTSSGQSYTACNCAPGFQGRRCEEAISVTGSPIGQKDRFPIPEVAFWIIVGVGCLSLIGVVVLAVLLFAMLQKRRRQQRGNYAVSGKLNSKREKYIITQKPFLHLASVNVKFQWLKSHYNNYSSIILLYYSKCSV